MTTERASYTDVFRQWVETSERLNDRLDELRPVTMQIDCPLSDHLRQMAS